MQFNIEKLLFFDIETVSQYKDLDELPKNEGGMHYQKITQLHCCDS